ncbi:MAG: hypothetical protein OER43_02070 [Gammaproteobacteria bacterium]|nr:hypothetical protein [Gammaproteobacteria bacterium]
MQDTSREFRTLVAERFAGMAAAERVRVGPEMFDTARALVEATLPKDLDVAELRFRICEQFCGELAARVSSGQSRHS